MWTQHEKSFRKIVNISHNRRFCGFIFKFVWAVYGGDLTGFCQSFRKVILKNDQRQTKSKKSQNVHGYEPFWYAHSTALPKSYPASIEPSAQPPECKALIGVGKLSWAGDRQIPECTDPFAVARKQDNIIKNGIFSIVPYQIWDQIWRRVLLWFRICD